MAVELAGCICSRFTPSPTRISPGRFNLGVSSSNGSLSLPLSCSWTKSRGLILKRSRFNVSEQSAAAAAASGYEHEDEEANTQGIAMRSAADSGPLASDGALVLSQRFRALFFYLTATITSVPLFLVMLVQQPLVLLLDKQRRKAQHLVNKIWAIASTYFFYKVEIIGKENLPHPDQPAVYIANHQSFLDIFVLFQLGRPFKFISKTSVFWIPVVGWAMYLTGHIPLHRMDTKSQLDCLRRCIECLKRGVSVCYFPEGTRSADGKLGAFKKGAFTSAAKAKVPVVPIALVGTGRLMPNGKEYLLRTGKVKMVIHPPVGEGNADELCLQARNCIANTLSESH